MTVNKRKRANKSRDRLQTTAKPEIKQAISKMATSIMVFNKFTIIKINVQSN